jgi:hypothetical protein
VVRVGQPPLSSMVAEARLSKSSDYFGYFFAALCSAQKLNCAIQMRVGTFIEISR